MVNYGTQGWTDSWAGSGERKREKDRKSISGLVPKCVYESVRLCKKGIGLGRMFGLKE